VIDDESKLLQVDDAILTNETMLPRFLKVVKHYVQSTALFQAHDVSKAHSTMNILAQHNSNVLVEGRDDGLIPDYLKVVDETLVEANVPTSSRGTYVKFFANAERWMDHAFGFPILSKGWVKSGQWSWYLQTFLKRYSGFKYLTSADLKQICEVMGYLTFIAYGNGTVTEEAVLHLLGG
jgi:hypothetical protein